MLAYLLYVHVLRCVQHHKLCVLKFHSPFQKGGLDYLKKEAADVFCVQETKCTNKEIPVEELKEAGYSAHFLSGDKAGYSGVGIIYKDEPVKITDGIGNKYACNHLSAPNVFVVFMRVQVLY